jgi:DNA primase
LSALIGDDVALRKSGKKHYGCCPFHAERTPSFAVDSVRGSYICRGCGASGDALAWMMQKKGLTFWDAVSTLALQAGLTMPKNEQLTSSDKETSKLRNGLYSVLRQAASLYSYALERSEDATAYLLKREISHETAKAFGLGYVRSGIRSVLAKRVFDPAWIAQAGVISVPEPGHEVEVLRNRLTIALRNERGVVVGFSGRLLVGERGPKYLNSPETLVFHKSRELFGLDLARSEIARQRSAILMEGYFDVMRLHQAGDTRAVAAMGTALSTEQAARVLRDVTVLYLCMDGDKAGQSAAIRAAKVLLAQLRDGQEIRVICLPDGQDPDDFVLAEGLQGWQRVLGASLRLSDFITTVLWRGLDPEAPESVVQCALDAREWVALCEHCPLYGKALQAALARRLGIDL